MKKSMSIEEASNLLEITPSSLRYELSRPDCPFGCRIILASHPHRYMYHVSSDGVKKWIQEHPNKFKDNPDYAPVKKRISDFSTDELINELKRRCVIQ